MCVGAREKLLDKLYAVSLCTKHLSELDEHPHEKSKWNIKWQEGKYAGAHIRCHPFRRRIFRFGKNFIIL